MHFQLGLSRNVSLNFGVIPDCHKCEIINPLIKKPGLNLELNNFRPVSNLRFLCKVIEGAVIEQLNKHIDITYFTDLHDACQLAYKKFHSTETLVTKIHDDIMENKNSNEVTMLVMLGLSAAFDTIDHNI